MSARPLARGQSRVVRVPVEERQSPAELLDAGRRVPAPHAAEAQDEPEALGSAVVLRSRRVQPEVEAPDAKGKGLRQLVDEVRLAGAVGAQEGDARPAPVEGGQGLAEPSGHRVPGSPRAPGQRSTGAQAPADGPSERGHASGVLVRGGQRGPSPARGSSRVGARRPGPRPADPWPRPRPRPPDAPRSRETPSPCRGAGAGPGPRPCPPGRGSGRGRRCVGRGPPGPRRPPAAHRPVKRNEVSRSSRHQPPVPRPTWKAWSPWPHAGSRGKPEVAGDRAERGRVLGMHEQVQVVAARAVGLAADDGPADAARREPVGQRGERRVDGAAHPMIRRSSGNRPSSGNVSATCRCCRPAKSTASDASPTSTSPTMSGGSMTNSTTSRASGRQHDRQVDPHVLPFEQADRRRTGGARTA